MSPLDSDPISGPEAAPAVVLLGHGSRRTREVRPLEGLCRMLQASEGRPVADAYLSLCPPTLEQTVEGLAARGHRAVDIIPMFVVAGHHVLEDLPRLLEALAQAHPGLALRVTPNLGADSAILPLLSGRLRQAETQDQVPPKT